MPSRTKASVPPRRSRRRHPARIEAEIRRLERYEALKRWLPGVVGLIIVVTLAAMEFTDSGRNWLARLLIVGLPLAVLVFGARHLREAEEGLRSAGIGVVAALAAGSELILVPIAMGHTIPRSAGPVIWTVLVALCLGASAVEGVGARRGIDTRLGAFAGIAAAFALYLAGRGRLGGEFDASLSALIVALPIGGAVGLGFGLIARWLAGARL